MDREKLFETIFKRKSVRKYDFTCFDDSILSAISEYMGTLKPMYNNIKTELKLLTQKDIRGIAAVNAPYYIAIFSEAKEGYLTNAGFMLQQMDLFLSSNGIGSCWAGLAKPSKEIMEDSGLEFVIVLAFGKPIEQLHRGSLSQFKRKSIDQICSIKGCDDIIEAVRLAPSSIDSQPWFFTGGGGTIHCYCVKSGMLKAIIYEKLNKIDIGIAICHLWIAANHYGKNAEIICDSDGHKNPPSGYYYISSIKLK